MIIDEKKPKNSVYSLELHREIGNSVLGAMILCPKAARTASRSLTPEVFHLPHHRLIFESCLPVIKSGAELDLVSLRAALGANLEKIGGIDALAEIAESVPSATAIEHYIKLLVALDWHLKLNKLERLEIFAGSIEAVEAHHAKLLSDLSASRPGFSRKVETFQETLRAIADAVDDSREGVSLPRFKTGFTELDTALSGGLRPGRVYSLIACPRIGKTALAMDIAISVAKQNMPVIIASKEMTAADLLSKTLAAYAEVPSSVADGSRRADDTQYSKIQNTLGEMYELPISVLDGADRNGLLHTSAIVEEVCNMREKLGVNPALVVADYWQILNQNPGTEVRGQNNDEKLKIISGQLRDLAKVENVAVLVLAQVNQKQVEHRENKMPTAADISASAGLFNDSSVVMALDRPSVFTNKDSKMHPAYIDILKNRQGAAGANIELTFNRGRFYDRATGQKGMDI